MIYLGIDDTDTLETRGTNQLARTIVAELADAFHCVWIARHQLLFDPRVPYTSKNGSASIALRCGGDVDPARLQERVVELMRREFISGSDPGLCVALSVPAAVRDFAHRCQREIVRQSEARTLAAENGLRLIGLGGTEDGVIGALAAVGLASEANDGRVVQLGTHADDLSGRQSLAALRSRGVEVRELETNESVVSGDVDVGKKLRPNLRCGRFVLFVQAEREPARDSPAWHAVRMT